MIPRRLLLGALMLAATQGASAQQRETLREALPETWKTYVNDRFGTSIEYPSRFEPGRPPDNNDGQGFSAADGGELLVWGSLNALQLDLKGLEAFVRENPPAGQRITYRAAGSNWFVLSGRRGDRIFYARYILSHRNEIQNAVEISYPARLAATYDPIAARISKSLKPGKGYDTTGAP